MKLSATVGLLAFLATAYSRSDLPFQSEASKEYLVSSKVPGIPFDLGPSWAGLMPLNGKATEPRKFFFWMFPAETDVGKDDLTIWLNGGPGCSSLQGLMQENGPFTLAYNSTEVKKSDYSWTKLSNVLWVEQPVSVGFSTGNSTATSQDEVSTDFRDFLDSFMNVFPEMKNKKLWLTGESYAGKYIPYIADKIYQRSDASNKRHGLNLQGIGINDPTFVNDYLGKDLASVEYVIDNNDQYFGFNDSFIQQLKEDAAENGMADYVKKNLKYPPAGPIEFPSKFNRSSYFPWVNVASAARQANPNFNFYNVQDSKLIYDPLGWPPAAPSPSENNFLNSIEGFKKAIHVNETKQWALCVQGVLTEDLSPPPIDSILPGVISKSVRTVVQHGLLDFIQLAAGSQLGIQNMTWEGKQGFQTKPHKTVYIDGKAEGLVHTERRLTYVQADRVGHMIPQDHPALAFRLQQFLLGQIGEEELSKKSSSKSNATQPRSDDDLLSSLLPYLTLQFYLALSNQSYVA